MAMVVKNNMSAVSTLNTLNKNSSALQKSLQKVSSGMKINSAQDDASGYAISEKMRVQIRSLDQANQNTQNASSMMKTAEGAVSSTVEILKSLKEKAINAATDTNTDSDRVTIQKELDQFIDQIDDNGLTTFNGKYLVDGSKSQRGQATYTAMTNQSLETGTNASTALTALANRNGDSLEIDTTDSITASYVRGGKTHTTTFKVENQNLGNIFDRLESLESDKIFASSSNTSVTGEGNTVRGDQPAISTTTGITATDSTSSSTSTSSSSGSYSVEELKAALDSANSSKDAAKTALDEANAKAGAFTWDSTSGVGTAVDRNYGAAAELAQAIEAAAKLDSDGANTATFTNGYYSGGAFIKTAAAGAAVTSGVGTFGLKNSNGTTAEAKVFNGRELEGVANDADKFNQKAIENAISAMTASENETVKAAGETLKTAYTNWNAAMNELKEAQDAYDTANKDVEVLTNAITAIEATAEAEAMTDTMVTELEKVFDGLAHPGGAASGALQNDQWVGIKDHTGTTDAYNSDTKVYKYSNDSDALTKVAQGIVGDLVANVANKGTGTTVAAAQTAAYTEMVTSLSTLASVDGANDGGKAAPTAAFTQAHYTAANVKLEGANAVFHPDSATTGDKGIDGTVFQDYAKKAAEAAFAKKQTDENTMNTTLAKAMERNGGEGGPTTTSDIALLTGSYVGSNSSGDAVYTADGTDGVTVTANSEGILGQVSGLTISVTDSDGNVKKAANAALDQFRTTIFAKNKSEANEMTFQVGAAANQSITVGLEDMRSEALGLKGSDGSKVSVATQDKANAAVAVFDNALQKALDQQTTIGAVEARLDYTSQNLTTSSENVQAAESTIRDADMAKEMTNYTKNNVLLQAAQSMLAQANQSSSQVLSLLQ